MLNVSPLTCQHCRNSPATEVVAADLAKVGGVVHLACTPCADYTIEISQWMQSRGQNDFVWRYALTPLPAEDFE